MSTIKILAPSLSLEEIKAKRTSGSDTGTAPAPMSAEQINARRKANIDAVACHVHDDFDISDVLAAISAAVDATNRADGLGDLYTQALEALIEPWYARTFAKAGVTNKKWLLYMHDKTTRLYGIGLRKLVSFEIDGERYVGIRKSESAKSSKRTSDELDPKLTEFMYTERITIAVCAKAITCMMQHLAKDPDSAQDLAATICNFDTHVLEERQREYVKATQGLIRDLELLSSMRERLGEIITNTSDIEAAVNARRVEIEGLLAKAEKDILLGQSRHKSVVITEEHFENMVPRHPDNNDGFKTTDGVYDAVLFSCVGLPVLFRRTDSPCGTESCDNESAGS